MSQDARTVQEGTVHYPLRVQPPVGDELSLTSGSICAPSTTHLQNINKNTRVIHNTPMTTHANTHLDSVPREACGVRLLFTQDKQMKLLAQKNDAPPITRWVAWCRRSVPWRYSKKIAC